MSLRTLIKPLIIHAMLLRERWQSGVAYNPLDARIYSDPYPTYTALRTKDPVHWSPLMDSWVFTRYPDADAILRDHRRFSNDAINRVSRRTVLPSFAEPSMLFLDPPDHSRLRSLVSKAFTPAAIEALEPRIRTIMQELLDEIDNPAAFDVMATIASPLPVTVIAELLGIPRADRDQFKAWSNQRARALEPMMTAQERDIAVRAGHELDAYFLGIITERRKEPQDDLISALVAAEEAGDKLTEREVLIMLRLLLIAGNETTTNLIGNGLLALLRHPEQLQMLRDDPALMPSAIQELLRYDSPVQLDARTAMEDWEVDGRQITKGQSLTLLLGAANHDPEVFTHPEQLDITRNEANNISFGRGIHHCLGAPLARLETHIAFEALLDRFGDIRLLTEHPPFKDNVVLRGLKELPVGTG